MHLRNNKQKNRFIVMLFGCAVTVVLWLSATAAHAVDQLPFAQPGDLAIAITLLTKDGTISASEPLIARVEIQNKVKESIRIWPDGTYLDVYDSKGALVSHMPRPQNVVSFRYSERNMAPGETYSKHMIITGLYQFKNPGQYTIRVQQLGLPKDLSVLCENAASILVRPYNSARLEAVCEELFAPIRRLESGINQPFSRTKALYSVQDDVVLPYLDWMAREWGNEYACLAMRRIGTPRAESLLNSLATRKDRVGKAAKQALNMPLEMSSWDISGN